MITMRQAVAIGGDGIDAVTLHEDAVPEPGAGEVLVRLAAATLNYRDLLFVDGLLPGLTKEPDYVPLSCAAGEVVSIGRDVTRVRVGDRVSPIFGVGWLEGRQLPAGMLGGNADGVARTHAVMPADSLVHLPATLGDMAAATLPCAGLTAWNALFLPRPLQAGEWVLCQGTGGVSIAALQFAKAMGAHVAITSSSDAKLDRARALGADVTVNYRTRSDWSAAVREQLGSVRIDIVVDVAGAGEVDAAASLLAPGGVVAAIGMLDGAFSWDRREIAGHAVAPISVGNRQEHEAMLAFVERHGIHPVVDVVYNLADLQHALRRLRSGDFFGKIGIDLT